jgi:hypothetical protein
MSTVAESKMRFGFVALIACSSDCACANPASAARVRMRLIRCLRSLVGLPVIDERRRRSLG